MASGAWSASAARVVAAAGAAAALLMLVRVRRESHRLGTRAAAPLRAHGPLRNCFIVVRHGQSEANVAGIISSDPAVGTVKHTLTGRGESQAKRAGTRIAAICAELGVTPRSVRMFCSDFTRTRRTAELAAAELGIQPSEITPRVELRERYFGRFDGTSSDNYEKVWVHDARSALHEEFGCESVASVVRRAGSLVVELDREFPGDCVVVLVCHGDIAQILRAAVEGSPAPAHHRDGEALQTGSVTRLQSAARR